MIREGLLSEAYVNDLLEIVVLCDNVCLIISDDDVHLICKHVDKYLAHWFTSDSEEIGYERLA